LTIALLDIAQNDPPESAKKKVKAYLTDDGVLTTEDKASFVVERELPANISSVGALSPTERAINKAITDVYREKGITPNKANSSINFSSDVPTPKKVKELKDAVDKKLDGIQGVFDDPGLDDPGLDIIESRTPDDFFPRDQIFQRQIERFSNKPSVPVVF